MPLDEAGWFGELMHHAGWTQLVQLKPPAAVSDCWQHTTDTHLWVSPQAEVS